MVFSESFDNASLPTALGLGAQLGGQLQLVSDPAETFGGKGKSLKVTYPAQVAGAIGASFAWGSVNLTPYNTNDVYIRFRAKMPKLKGGLKFAKIFNQQPAGTGYAHATFGLDYGLGTMTAVSFGDGTALENDAQQAIRFDGTNPDWVGRSYGKSGFLVSTPQGKSFEALDWGTDWHLFELYAKFNSGTSAATEKNDGEFFVRIDGRVYVDAKGLFNRNYKNLPLERIEILGWSQPPEQESTPSFEVWYDDIQVSIHGH